MFGIASDVAIWKLCYEINNLLSLNLQAIALPESFDDPTHLTNLPSLFLDTQIPTTLRPVAYYEDMDTVPLQEFMVFAPTKSKLPAEAKAFSFFFVVRSALISANFVPDLLQKLNAIEFIRSVVDLSDLKNLKNSLL